MTSAAGDLPFDDISNLVQGSLEAEGYSISYWLYRGPTWAPAAENSWTIAGVGSEAGVDGTCFIGLDVAPSEEVADFVAAKVEEWSSDPGFEVIDSGTIAGYQGHELGYIDFYNRLFSDPGLRVRAYIDVKDGLAGVEQLSVPEGDPEAFEALLEQNRQQLESFVLL